MKRFLVPALVTTLAFALVACLSSCSPNKNDSSDSSVDLPEIESPELEDIMEEADPSVTYVNNTDDGMERIICINYKEDTEAVSRITLTFQKQEASNTEASEEEIQMMLDQLQEWDDTYVANLSFAETINRVEGEYKGSFPNVELRLTELDNPANAKKLVENDDSFKLNDDGLIDKNELAKVFEDTSTYSFEIK